MDDIECFGAIDMGIGVTGQSAIGADNNPDHTSISGLTKNVSTEIA